ncbi:MAG TPA: HAD family hydrolase [Syntrophomonadaceae bacterium]|nr:HAD family hydrolase [Syntrophomonadaceae bacterium]
MFKAILFDLDATLLNIDMDDFLKHYFQKMTVMAREFGIANSDHLVRNVWESTDAMIADLDPSTTNEDAFMRDFFSSGYFTEQDQIRRFFDFFYEKGFPQLKKYCGPIPGIPEMMEKVIKNHRVIIATNAVFPMKALKDRLAWAGLGHLEFDLITSYEIMHFCKPHVQYYQEIMDRLRLKPSQCLMVGNDMGEDLAAGQLGIKTFLVEDMLIEKDVPYQPDWRGHFTDLFAFMEKLG